MTALRVEGLATGYGDLRIVTDVTLEVTRGQVTALLGRNGAGKTTTLRAIAGLNSVDGGRVLLEGHDISRLSPSARAKTGIGYVQEGKRIFRSRTVEENLLLGTFASRDRRRARHVVAEMYERFPMLAQMRRKTASHLSGGQQQILAIAQALAAEPDILLLDEPSAGLAPTIVADILETVRDIRGRGLGVLLVEQAVNFALSISDVVAVLDLGRTVYTAPADDPSLRDAIQDAYLAAGAK